MWVSCKSRSFSCDDIMNEHFRDYEDFRLLVLLSSGQLWRYIRLNWCRWRVVCAFWYGERVYEKEWMTEWPITSFKWFYFYYHCYFYDYYYFFTQSFPYTTTTAANMTCFFSQPPKMYFYPNFFLSGNNKRQLYQPADVNNRV